jgi:hypothetical protein
MLNAFVLPVFAMREVIGYWNISQGNEGETRVSRRIGELTVLFES